jgi:hypothetical protein
MGGSIGEDGNVIEEPTGIKLRDAKVYDTTKYIWPTARILHSAYLKTA